MWTSRLPLVLQTPCLGFHPRSSSPFPHCFARLFLGDSGRPPLCRSKLGCWPTHTDAYLAHSSLIHGVAYFFATNFVDIIVLHVGLEACMVEILPLMDGIVPSPMCITQLFIHSLQLFIALHENQKMQEGHKGLASDTSKGWNNSSLAKMPMGEVLSANPEMVIV